MRVVVTGADGFIGKNLSVRLLERAVEVVPITRNSSEQEIRRAVEQSEAVFHIAGVNRSDDPLEFSKGNVQLTETVCDAIRAVKRSEVPVIFASSRRAGEDTEYGRTKAAAEAALVKLGEAHGNPVHIFRLPNVFGKWCRPGYNSVVATFCHNIARNLPIHVVDPDARIDLVHIDDVVTAFINIMLKPAPSGYHDASPVYETTVGKIAGQLQAFQANQAASMATELNDSFTQALYATYLSYLPSAEFGKTLTTHGDNRGFFGEILRTPNSGQFSVFTAQPGMTRGNHYHHRKAEKFVVVEGEAIIRMRHISSNETIAIPLCGAKPTIVDVVPGWCHNITNTGSTVLVALLWASEIFDPDRPDTIPLRV